MRNILSVCLLLVSIDTIGQKSTRLASPDGRIVFTLELKQKQLLYGVVFKGNNLIVNSALSLAFSDEVIDGSNLMIGKTSFRQGQEYSCLTSRTGLRSASR